MCTYAQLYNIQPGSVGSVYKTLQNDDYNIILFIVFQMTVIVICYSFCIRLISVLNFTFCVRTLTTSRNFFGRPNVCVSKDSFSEVNFLYYFMFAARLIQNKKWNWSNNRLCVNYEIYSLLCEIEAPILNMKFISSIGISLQYIYIRDGSIPIFYRFWFWIPFHYGIERIGIHCRNR